MSAQMSNNFASDSDDEVILARPDRSKKAVVEVEESDSGSLSPSPSDSDSEDEEPAIVHVHTAHSRAASPIKPSKPLQASRKKLSKESEENKKIRQMSDFLARFKASMCEHGIHEESVVMEICDSFIHCLIQTVSETDDGVTFNNKINLKKTLRNERVIKNAKTGAIIDVPAHYAMVIKIMPDTRQDFKNIIVPEDQLQFLREKKAKSDERKALLLLNPKVIA